ncbi:MAG: ISLre2 family transposase [Chloroflexota bacterium]
MDGWEKQILSSIFGQGQAMARTTLEEADRVLMRGRGVGLTVVGFRERRVVTLLGDVRIRRRLYRDDTGKGRYLLDEAMGLEKRSPLSAGVRELSALLGSYMPFGKCETLLRVVLPTGVSHTTVHRQIGRMTEPVLAKEEEEVVEVFERGKVPEAGTREVPLLFLEGDGVSVALQREKERRAEVKVGIAYEGWEEIGSRYSLKDKTVYLGLMDSGRFWEGFSLALAGKYNLGRVGQVVVGGDGAHWVKKGAELCGGIYQLDRFHLRRALLRGLGGKPVLADEIYRACIVGDIALADGLLVQAQSQADKESALEIAGLRSYILDNACGLADYRLKLEKPEGLRGLGGIEGNVNHLVASRMKKRGMSWTKRGVRRMTRLIQMQHEGQIPNWKTLHPSAKQEIIQEQPTFRAKDKKRDAGAWLNTVLPALKGPHHNRPWVLALDHMAHGEDKTTHRQSWIQTY